MQLSEVFLSLGQDTFAELIHGISISRLRTYQLYETFKTRTHLVKLNTESLRKAVPRFWVRLNERDEDFARDLAQSILISRLDMIAGILNLLGVPNQDGFFDKNLQADKYLTEGWQQRVYEQFHGNYPEAVLLLYINHLAWELQKEPQMFAPAKA